jgi:hypothetical protein
MLHTLSRLILEDSRDLSYTEKIQKEISGTEMTYALSYKAVVFKMSFVVLCSSAEQFSGVL